ncbi:FTR1 family iron permease [Azospira sp. APE16]|jgi:high-affinity iron transporter|uniref:High-affinity Fe2+/Pb2+ permease n=2 Tax=Azospira oryzae TaxID=146939 RepID=G8QFH6_AZOOP|nr:MULTISPECIES: FTR1 family protein [Azospira]TLS18513.1 MAG: FTR1 family iron permease [Betaproteobacteria bacterium]AEV26042.1 high-affinity Fe2+/Pb2+ permease [Azospira oryzae PS]MBP7489867.1 FTR1 family protein [Azospira sp.]MDK9690481.1 FTR1 family protein [Azospira sp.]RZT75693.1 high-affinity iron transporter [Azospira oryzae]
MLNALIVVWRESLEAMLVVGVLLAWIARQEDASRLRRTLWSGVGGGTLLALALAFLAYGAQTWLDGESLELFQIGMLLLACVLMTQMVMWMRRHGASMKRELEAGASRAAETGGRLGVALVAALAIGREGMETVVFLYGMAAERQGSELLGLYGMAALGFVIAGLTAWAVARGARFFSYRTVFRVSEVVLLVTAGSLLGAAVDRLIGMDWLPTLMDLVWDTSAVLDDGSGLGQVLSTFAGYRAQPTAMLLLAYALYWGYVALRLRSFTPNPSSVRADSCQPTAAP